MNSEKPREIAVRILTRREHCADYLENLLESALARNPLSGPDRSLLQELTFGVVRWQGLLDWLIDRKTGGRTQKPRLRVLLRLGLYQLFWLDRVPEHAAVHETVELAKGSQLAGQAGFVNAVLRSYARERSATQELLRELKTNQPHIGFSHPEWLYLRWEKTWGREASIRLMEWNNQPPKIFARVNTLKTDAGQLTALWEREGIKAVPFECDWIPPGLMFHLESVPSLSTLDSFQQGFFYIQDPSTLLAVEMLDPKPNETVLDMCSAPGGKTSYAAQRMQNTGLISAQDLLPQRLRMLDENCTRLGLKNIEISRPSEIVFPELTAEFDRILVDAPCSNTGVIRRRVDLRWRIEPAEIARLRKIQTDLLHQASMQMKPGGPIIYSTCSLEPEENREVVDEFLKAHPDFSLETERQLIPFQDGVDGAYVVKLLKKSMAGNESRSGGRA